MRHFILLSLWLAGSAQAVLCIAHRGFSASFPANSMAAIDAAWEADAPVVEIDLRRTVDGNIVLVHDAEINNREVCDLSYAQLQALTPGHHVPTLPDVLATMQPGRVLLLDLKEQQIDFLEQLVRLLDAYAIQPDHVLLQSTQLQSLVWLRKHLPQRYPLFFVSKLERRGLFRRPPDADRLAARLVKADLDGITAKGRQFIDAAFVDAFHEHDLRYFVWTLNDPSRYRHYAQLGVDGIITDDPVACLQALDQAEP